MYELREINQRLEKIGISEQSDIRTAELLLLLVNCLEIDKVDMLKSSISKLNEVNDLAGKKAIIKQIIDKDLSTAYQNKLDKLNCQEKAIIDLQEQIKKINNEKLNLRELYNKEIANYQARVNEIEECIKEKENKLLIALEKIGENEKELESNRLAVQKNDEIVSIMKDAFAKVETTLKEELNRTKIIYEKNEHNLRDELMKVRKYNDEILEKLNYYTTIKSRKDSISTLFNYNKKNNKKKQNEDNKKEYLSLITLLKKEKVDDNIKSLILSYYDKGVTIDHLSYMINEHFNDSEIKLFCERRI